MALQIEVTNQIFTSNLNLQNLNVKCVKLQEWCAETKLAEGYYDVNFGSFYFDFILATIFYNPNDHCRTDVYPNKQLPRSDINKFFVILSRTHIDNVPENYKNNQTRNKNTLSEARNWKFKVLFNNC